MSVEVFKKLVSLDFQEKKKAPKTTREKSASIHITENWGRRKTTTRTGQRDIKTLLQRKEL